MTTKFVRYRTFNDKAIATQLCETLSNNQIPFEWESTEGFFDASFANNDILNLYYVKIRPEDFAKVDQLLMNSVVEDKQEPVGDYYLFSFSNDELLEVVYKPYEWNEFDLYWARKILAARGVEIKAEHIEEAKKEELKKIKKPWELGKAWVFCALAAGVFSLFILHVFWSLAVFFVGLYIAFGKRTTPDGERIYAFSENDRFYGKLCMVVGAVLSLYILSRYFGYFELIGPL